MVVLNKKLLFSLCYTLVAAQLTPALSPMAHALTLSEVFEGQVFKRDRLAEPMFSQNELARIRMNRDNDPRKDAERKVFSQNPDGIITGSDVLDLMKLLQTPMPESDFIQRALMQGMSNEQAKARYLEYKQNLEKDFNLNAQRAVAVLALNRIIDEEAYQRGLDPHNLPSSSSALSAYAYRTIMIQMGLYSQRIPSKTEEVEETVSSPFGDVKRKVKKRIPLAGIERLSNEELLSEYKKILSWNEKRIDYVTRLVLLQGAAMSKQIPTIEKEVTHPTSGKVTKEIHPSDEAASLSNEALYPHFQAFMKDFLKQLGSRSYSLTIDWKYRSGGLDALLDQVTSLPDHAYLDSIVRLPGFSNEAELPKSYAEFKEAIQTRMTFVHAQVQDFNQVKWDSSYATLGAWEFREIQKQVKEQGLKPFAVALDQNIQNPIEIYQNIQNQMLPAHTAQTRSQIWNQIVGRYNPGLERELQEVLSISRPQAEERLKVFNLIKEKFKKETREVSATEISLSGEKRSEWLKEFAKNVTEIENAFRKEMQEKKWTQTDALKIARERRDDVIQNILEKTREVVSENVQSTSAKLNVVEDGSQIQPPKTWDEQKTANLRSSRMAAAEQSLLVPFFNNLPTQPGVAHPEVIQLVILDEIKITGATYPDPENREIVQKEIAPIIQSKRMGAAEREAAYQLFQRHRLDLTNNLCEDPLWPCVQDEAHILAEALFPETIYPGESLPEWDQYSRRKRTSSLGSNALLKHVSSIETSWSRASFQVTNPRRNR